MTGELIRLKSFPRYRVIERELFRCRAAEITLLQALGPPTSEINPPLGQGDPRMFWDVEFPCGLVMGLQFDRLTEHLVGYLDSPDVNHALRHLGVRPTDLWLLESADPQLFAKVAPPVAHTFALWECEGDSEPELLGSKLSERDARCQLAELDGLEPGVRMWVAGTDEEPKPPVLGLQKPRIGRVSPDGPSLPRRPTGRVALTDATDGGDPDPDLIDTDIIDELLTE